MWKALPLFSKLFKKPLSAKITAFFPRFISVQHCVLGRMPMNGSLVCAALPQGKATLNGRVFLIGSSF
jgi:hypothetical protein